MRNLRMQCAKRLIIAIAAVSTTLSAQQVRVVNVVPQTLSGEVGRDSEPSIAVNPKNPRQIVISAFTRDPGGAANAPLFLSVDGGNTWTLSTPVVTGAATSSCIATLCDISLRFADSSDFLYVSALAGDTTTGVTTYRIQRIGNTFAVPTSDSLRTRTGTTATSSIPDQPYIEAHTVLGGSGVGQDRVSVPFNDLTVTTKMTATVDHTLSSVPPDPAGFSGTVVESRATTGQDSPSVRAAVHQDGTIYAAFTAFRTGGNEIVVARDDNWGSGATPFRALVDTDGLFGIRVVTGLTQSLGSLGTQRVSSPLTIGVHPTDSRTVYIAYAEGSTTANFTVHIRNSTNGGATWSGDLFTVTSAMNPSIAVNARGEAGLLYQRLTGTGTAQRYETHFVLSNDGSFAAASNTDTLLANVPTAAGPNYGGPNPVGDYSGLMANGKAFYGVFSANNTPDTANFHSSLVYPRNHNFTTHALTDLMGAAVNVSVDPFFFAVTNTTDAQDFYVRDWSNSPTVHDDGEEPSTDPVFFANSDIWNRRDNTRGNFDGVTDRPDHQDPRELAVGHNFAFTRIHRKTAAAPGASDVDVHATFLFADYGLGTPYVNAGTAAAPTLTFTAADTSKNLEDGQGYEWDLPSGHSDHVCMAVQLDAPNDLPAGTLLGHAVGWPTTDLMVINDNNKAQRNMRVWIAPTGGTDSLTGYFIVHNAASFPRDMTVRYEVSPQVARNIRVSKIELLGAREGRTAMTVLKNGQTFNLSGMQPGENRWLGVTMSVIGATKGRFLPVRFTEVANGQALNGLEIGPRVAAPQTVFYENLLLHAAVFHRLQILFSLKAQEESKEAVELAKSDPTTAPYVKFMKSHGKPIAVLSTDLLQLTPSAGDPFGIKLGILRLQTALKNGNPVSIAIAHAALLEKLDAFSSMLDKSKGDTADILQNVYWQKYLFARLPISENAIQQVTGNSANFIHAFEANQAAPDALGKLLQRLIPEFEQTAATFHSSKLNSTVAEMKNNLDNPQRLQKIHRDYLLALQGFSK